MKKLSQKAKYILIILVTVIVTVAVTLCVFLKITESLKQNEAYTLSNSDSITVYITKTGSCYHRNNCKYLKYSKLPISLEDAYSENYSSCSKCHPPKISKE